MILVTGSIAFDHIMKFSGLFQDEILPDKLNTLSLSLVVSGKKTHFGGCAGNIAYNLRILGSKPLPCSVVGKDFESYLTHLKKNGIVTEGLHEIKDEDTASATIVTDVDGRQLAFFYPGAMNHEHPRLEELFSGYDIEFAIIAPDNPARFMQATELALKNKIPYLFDPGQIIPILPADFLKDAMKSAYGTIVNEYEMALLEKQTHLHEADLIAHTDIFIKTRGADGVQIFKKDSVLDIPALACTNPVDPTGCGDAFRAGFVHSILKGETLQKAAHLGAALAVSNLECEGTQNHTALLA